MSDRIIDSTKPPQALRVPRVSLAPLVAISEAIVSRRGLAILFFGLFGLLIFSGWLRPPLSGDISSLRVPLWILRERGLSPESISQGDRAVPWDSGGVGLLIIAGVGCVAALWRPQCLPLFAGALLAGTIVVNSTAAIGHPAVIELLDDEVSQRDNMVEALNRFYEHSLSKGTNGLVQETHSYAPSTPLLDGWPYLLYGKWAAALALLCLLLCTRGSLARRFKRAIVWVLLGACCAGLLCLPRFLGEFYLYRARSTLFDGNYSSSRRFLERAVSTFPELGRLQRTWLLSGELDFCQGRTTPESQFWQVRQYLSDGRHKMARGLLENVAKEAHPVPPIPLLAGGLWASLGMNDLTHNDFGAAEIAFRKALSLQPGRLDCLFLLGVVHAHMDRHHPEFAEADISSFLNRCADPQLRADALDVLGDAYFDADTMTDARDCYLKSWDVYNLLENINFRAQKGLGGL